MALISDPGADDADSLVEITGFKTYADNYGFDYSAFEDAKLEQSARRSTDWLNATYRFAGDPTYLDQALEWPRAGVLYRGEYLDEETIPEQVKKAVYEAMRRDLAEPGALAPDVEAGGIPKRIKAGSVEIERFATASQRDVFQTIEGLLTGFLLGGDLNAYTARAVRA